jgi:hypothetical protein
MKCGHDVAEVLGISSQLRTSLHTHTFVVCVYEIDVCDTGMCVNTNCTRNTYLAYSGFVCLLN